MNTRIIYPITLALLCPISFRAQAQPAGRVNLDKLPDHRHIMLFDGEEKLIHAAIKKMTLWKKMHSAASGLEMRYPLSV